MVRISVLDVDGTLMDTNYLHVEAWSRAMREVGLQVPRYKLHRQIGKGADQLIPEFVAAESDRERVSELHGEFYAELQPNAHPLPGAADLIARLAESDVEVWLATSAAPEELEGYLEQLAAENRITGIVSSSEVEESKPAPDIFEETLRRAGAEALEAAAVGDAIWDLQSARAAGIRTAGVLTGGAFSRPELAEAGAAAVFEDCEELLREDFFGLRKR